MTGGDDGVDTTGSRHDDDERDGGRGARSLPDPGAPRKGGPAIRIAVRYVRRPGHARELATPDIDLFAHGLRPNSHHTHVGHAGGHHSPGPVPMSLFCWLALHGLQAPVVLPGAFTRADRASRLFSHPPRRESFFWAVTCSNSVDGRTQPCRTGWMTVPVSVIRPG
jgi:hypothetical protein